jgi:hypothetical protein
MERRRVCTGLVRQCAQATEGQSDSSPQGVGFILEETTQPETKHDRVKEHR